MGSLLAGLDPLADKVLSSFDAIDIDLI
jgi:hypothetical protein